MNNKLIDKIIDRPFGEESTKSIEVTDLGRCIIVMDRGWVLAADVTQGDGRLSCKNVFVVRRWGTTKGLGELAEDGALDNTILDRQPDTIVFEHAVHQIITNSKL